MGIETRWPLGEDLEASLAEGEARFKDMRPGHEKEVIWAGKQGKRTEYVVVYIHGFSASKGEIRPVPDRVADGLKANLFYTRLPGHGRNGRAMAETELSEWHAVMEEALEVGSRLGDKLILMSCSTGCTLVTAGLVRPENYKNVVANIFVAPNFGVQPLLAQIAYLPGAARWIEKIAGQERGFEPTSEDHAKWWTMAYPPSSIVPMMYLIRECKALRSDQLTLPTLAIYTEKDQVVRASAIKRQLAKWGAPVTHADAPMGEGVDDHGHVVMGDILSPGNTEWGVKTMQNWLDDLLP